MSVEPRVIVATTALTVGIVMLSIWRPEKQVLLLWSVVSAAPLAPD